MDILSKDKKSTCHWCHVMEHESFEDIEVANLINANFVAIKVDREERPDIDHIYMGVCQVMTGQGGWPLSIFMTADKMPFFAGTYFPKNNRMGIQGFMSLLNAVKTAWSGNRKELLESSEKIVNALNREASDSNFEIQEDIIERAFEQLKGDFDSVYGGFRSAPKFPTPHNLYFLLRYWKVTQDKAALDIVCKTLDSMYRGGIYDHIGFGFSRYSTDKRWLVPHFEKMLYDNALIAIAYLEAYQATKIEGYKVIAREIFTYITRDMTNEEGAFYSAEDADSEGVEGKFYVWTLEEIKTILGEVDGERFATYYDISVKGNFEGKNIPNLIKNPILNEDTNFVNKCKKVLYANREKRIHPFKDDKILTGWNGLMIAAMSIGGRMLGDEELTLSAERAVAFIFKNLVRKDGRLLARYRGEEAAHLGYVDDYAFLIWGLIELYETTFKPIYLKYAIELNEDMIKYFWDKSKGGFFVYGEDGETLLTRPKEIYDGATPSGNSVAALNLLKLGRITGNVNFEELGIKIFECFGKEVDNFPSGYTFFLIAFLYSRKLTREIVLVGDENSELTMDMLRVINERYDPFMTIIFHSLSNTKELRELIPSIYNYEIVKGKSSVYICENFKCNAPITSIDQLKKLL